MTIEKSIGWTDMTINPIKGICKGNCWYCWTKPLYQRKFLTPDIRLRLDVLERLPKKPKRIFLCSTHDLFGDWIPTTWRDSIFGAVKQFPQHIFQILTKFPGNIDRPMPDNVWLGVTVTGEMGSLDRDRLDIFRDIKANIKFISYEPVLSEVGFEEKDKIDWLIIGALTGYSYENRRRPHVVYLQRLVESYKRDGTKIFLKNNLKKIWKQPLIQEFPDV